MQHVLVTASQEPKSKKQPHVSRNRHRNTGMERQNVALPTVALEGNTKPWVLHYWQLQLDLCCDMCGNKTSAECHRHANKTGCWNGIQSNANCLVGFLIFLPSCQNNHHMYSNSTTLGLWWPFLICIADVSAVIVIVTMTSMSLMNWFEISIAGLAGSLFGWIVRLQWFLRAWNFLTSLTDNLGVHPNVGTTTSHLLQINSSTIANGAILSVRHHRGLLLIDPMYNSAEPNLDCKYVYTILYSCAA